MKKKAKEVDEKKTLFDPKKAINLEFALGLQVTGWWDDGKNGNMFDDKDVTVNYSWVET